MTFAARVVARAPPSGVPTRKRHAVFYALDMSLR